MLPIVFVQLDVSGYIDVGVNDDVVVVVLAVQCYQADDFLT